MRTEFLFGEGKGFWKWMEGRRRERKQGRGGGGEEGRRDPGRSLKQTAAEPSPLPPGSAALTSRSHVSPWKLALNFSEQVPGGSPQQGCYRPGFSRRSSVSSPRSEYLALLSQLCWSAPEYAVTSSGPRLGSERKGISPRLQAAQRPTGRLKALALPEGPAPRHPPHRGGGCPAHS